MGSLVQDLRHSLRAIRRSPTLAAVIMVSLALGIGANTALFTVVRSVLIEPLPYEDPDRLVVVWEIDLAAAGRGEKPRRGSGLLPLTFPNFLDYRERNRVLWMSGYSAGDGTVSADDQDATKLLAAGVFADFFEILGVEPVLGRTFLPDEEQAGRNKVATISHSLWQSWFAGDRGVLGETIRVEGQDYEVVGVMPPDFDFPKGVRVWKPTGYSLEEIPGNVSFIRGIARLRSGTSLAAAEEEMNAIALRLQELRPTNKDRGISLVPLYESVVGEVRPALLVLWGAVGFVLLIACANAASLQLARGKAREAEIGVRTVLGAGRGRLVRQLLTESVLLSLGGGVAGLLVGWLGLRALLPLGDVPRLEEIQLDAAVLGFTLGLSLLSGVVFGIIPAFQLAGAEVSEALKEGGGRLRSSTRGRRFHRLLVVLQAGIAVTLVVGAGLLVRSFAQLVTIDPGFDAENVLTMEVNLPATQYADRQKAIGFYKELLERVDALPGVEVASSTLFLPMSGRIGAGVISREVPTGDSAVDRGYARVQAVTPGFFECLGIPVLQGRTVSEDDDDRGRDVVVINASAARHFFPDLDPIGQRLILGANFGPAGRTETRPHEVVGVVGDIRFQGLDQPVGAEVYFPRYQNDWKWGSLVLRTSTEPLNLAAPVIEQVKEMDPALAVGNLRTLEQRVSDSVAKPRFNLWLMSVFALIALILAVVGVYGIASYAADQKTHEVGVRMAVGAKQSHVLWLVLSEGLLLGLAGILLGLGGAYSLTHWLSSLLYEVAPTDQATFAGASLILLGAVSLASYLPARRLAGVEPAKVLRGQ